jgi:hypothetical protein
MPMQGKVSGLPKKSEMLGVLAKNLCNGVAMDQTCKLVGMSSLKRLAAETLRHTSTLKELILTEKDYLSSLEFLAKLDIWLKLLDKETRV